MRLLAIRRTLITTLLAAPWLAMAQGSAWPSKPVRLVVPFPAGGSTDLLARSIAQRLGQSLGQTVVVDNKAGAGGSLGSTEVAKAPADGYTLLIATNSTHANAPNLVLVPQTLPVASIKDLIAYAKARPGQLNYASSGNGTIVHLTSESFKSQAGVFITHIPYRGTALAIPDLDSGKVHLLFDSLVSGLPHVKDGKLKALAITSRTRSALVPDVPTVAESGLPGFESTTWFGIYGPKGLPADIAARLNSELNLVMKTTDVSERLARLGAEPAPANTAAQFAALVAADSARWAQLIRERKISVE